MESNDYKLIKKDYGENMAKLCRTLFSDILERPGLLYSILSSKFAKSRSLYADIVEAHKEFVFKEYIYHFADIETERENITNKTVKELLDEQGYILYECINNEDIAKFKKYYARNEELCTFDDPHRIDNYYIFFIVKKDVDQIKREDFTDPKREDRYSTSVLDLQFDKGERQRVSIKSRYNHRVSNPDAIFSNNLEAIAPGLTAAFHQDYGFNMDSSNQLGFMLYSYIMAHDNKLYKYNYEIRNVHYCPNNIIIDNGEVIDKYSDKSRYTFIDYFILDEQEKKIILYDDRVEDSFVDDLNNITDIKIKNKDDYKEVVLTLDRVRTAIIKLDKNNRIIGYENSSITSLDDKFLNYNKSLKEINLENLEECGRNFLFSNKDLEKMNLPKLKKCGEYLLYSNTALKELDLPNLEECGNWCIGQNHLISEVNLPRLRECGNSFLLRAEKLKKLDVPSLEKCESSFVAMNEKISDLNAPNLVECGDSFLRNNNALTRVNLPKLKKTGQTFILGNTKISEVNLESLEECGTLFLSNNLSLESLNLPKLKKCGNNFLSGNANLSHISAPNLETCQRNFLLNNKELREVELPSLKECGDYFLGWNKNIREVNFPNLESCESNFMSSNLGVRSLNLPKLSHIEEEFFSSNKVMRELNLPNLSFCKGKVFNSHSILKTDDISKIKKVWKDSLVKHIKEVIRYQMSENTYTNQNGRSK